MTLEKMYHNRYFINYDKSYELIKIYILIICQHQ